MVFVFKLVTLGVRSLNRVHDYFESLECVSLSKHNKAYSSTYTSQWLAHSTLHTAIAPGVDFVLVGTLHQKDAPCRM